METYHLRPVWDGILSIFDAFQKICERNHLRFYMAYGSALGTVRHHGFIPWDDDVDVIMLRDEYEKLNIIASKEFSGFYGNWRKHVVGAGGSGKVFIDLDRPYTEYLK